MHEEDAGFNLQIIRYFRYPQQQSLLRISPQSLLPQRRSRTTKIRTQVQLLPPKRLQPHILVTSFHAFKPYYAKTKAYVTVYYKISIN
jgi:hypothetical protein